MIRLLRAIAIELRVANDLAQVAGLTYGSPLHIDDLDLKRDAYRWEMS
jgi:hypothetical protein